MKIESLRLKGFIGIQRGIGLDEITIDFNQVVGLTAFDGLNGTGKSSVLENLSPFSQLASRDGALYQHCYLRDSEKELSFTYQGNSYRTLVKIDCQGGKSEGYVYKNGKSETNGKITEYNKYIRNLLGSPELFFASVFCSQNSTKLSDMTTGQLKGLFTEFLRLDRYQAWEDTAKQAANILQGKAGALDNRIATLQETIVKKEDVTLAYCEAGSKATDLRDDKTLLEMALVAKRQEIDTLKESLSQNALALERKRDIQKQIDQLETDLTKEKAAAETVIGGLAANYREIKYAIGKLSDILAEREQIENAAVVLCDLEASLITLQAKIDQLTGQGTKHQAEAHKIETEIAQWKAGRKALDSDTQMIEAEREVANLTYKLTGAKQALVNIQNDKSLTIADDKIAVAKDKMRSLDLKDPACQSSSCDFIVEALKAQAILPALEAERDRLRVELNDMEAIAMAGIDGFQAEIAEAKDKLNGRHAAVKVLQETIDAEINRAGLGLDNVKYQHRENGVMLTANREHLAKTRNVLALQKAVAEKLPEVRVAGARKIDLEKQLHEITEQGMAKKAAWIDRENALKLTIQSERDRLDAIAIDPFVGDALAIAQKESKEIETVKFPALEKEVQAARDKIDTLRAEIRRIEEAEKDLVEVHAQKELLVRDVGEWRYLQAAIGKNGLQALEIDGAAPLITGYANDLLSRSFGPLFSVKLVTQDSQGRECLDIVVITEDGEEILLENLSGGQKVWCLMALRLAMTLLSKEKSGHKFQTAFADELDGALDAGNALSFVNMYRSFMQVGGFESFFFISHRQGCKGLADNVLKLEHGKIPFWG